MHRFLRHGQLKIWMRCLLFAVLQTETNVRIKVVLAMVFFIGSTICCLPMQLRFTTAKTSLLTHHPSQMLNVLSTTLCPRVGTFWLSSRKQNDYIYHFTCVTIWVVEKSDLPSFSALSRLVTQFASEITSAECILLQ